MPLYGWRVRKQVFFIMENRVPEASVQGQPRSKQNRGHKQNVWFVVKTILLVGIFTVFFFTLIFLSWVNRSLKGNVEVYIDEFESQVSTELYYQDDDTGEWIMYQTLFLEGEDRIWASLDQIPESIQNAAVAIEDKRFYRHKGVDVKGTIRAVVYTLTGHSIQGGSTITQQLVKNITDDNETTVKRKITEIYRALEMEKRYSKEEILEAYLNEIYLGYSCYGVQAGSMRYFGKSVEELSIAESATLIAITNNPSRFGPFESDWARGQNRTRQVLILQAMQKQGFISQEEYEEAYNEEVVFTNGFTNMGNYVREHLDELDADEQTAETVVAKQSTAWNSYFTDAVIEDVAQYFMSEYGYDYSSAIDMVYGKGYKIYTTQDYEIQEIAESVLENIENLPYQTASGEQLQGAVTIMDPYNGYVVAMVGGSGPKVVDRGWNWATEPRPCGSATKPISVYAPALDSGVINGATTIDDFPLYMLQTNQDDEGAEPEYEPWPKNDSGDFRGLVTMKKAITASLNTCAVRVCDMLGTFESYDFMTSKLHFTTLTQTDSEQLGNMALGGYSVGVTTEEMCAAYCIFPNEGIYTEPRTFTRIEDQNGNVIYENEIVQNQAIKDTTAYIMNNCLQGVISGGTGAAAWFEGMNMAGKTGTTNDIRDKYFVGYTPYYCAACWVGYESNSKISSGGVNPATILWRDIMSKIHEGLDNKSFPSCDGVITVNACMDSGMLATTSCEGDARGSRVYSAICTPDNLPEEMCTMHNGMGTLNYTRVHFLDFPDVVAADDAYVIVTQDMGIAGLNGATQGKIGENQDEEDVSHSGLYTSNNLDQVYDPAEW